MERTIHKFRDIYMKRAGFLNGSDENVSYPIIKWADNQSELEEAFSLVHREYLRSGYLTKADPSGIFFGIHNLLRHSATLVAKNEIGTVGTLSVVLDNDYLGLPMDCLYVKELERLRCEGRRLCELCALAVSNEFRNGRLIMPLFRTMYWHAVSSKMDDICIMVNPKHVPFYKKILLFEEIGPEKIYPRLRAPAVCLRLDLSAWKEKAQEAYRGFDSVYNIYEYFESREGKDRESLTRAGKRCPMNRSAILYFLHKEKNILNTLNSKDLFYIISQSSDESAGKWKSQVQ